MKTLMGLGLGLGLVLLSTGCVDLAGLSIGATNQQEQSSGLTGPNDLNAVCPVAGRLDADIRGADTIAVGDSTSVSFTPFTAENQEVPDDCAEKAGIQIEDINNNCTVFLGTNAFFPLVVGVSAGVCKIVGTVPGATASVEITVS